MSSKRNWILATVMAAAVVIGYIALTGKAPMKTDTQGAIGAANRYQTQQIAAGDVSLKDAKIQASRETMEASVRRIQSTIRTTAVLLPPLPMFLVGLTIFVRRQRRERDASRRRTSPGSRSNRWQRPDRSPAPRATSSWSSPRRPDRSST